MMKIRLFFCLLAVGGGAMADQVALKNGDRITGSIVKKDGGSLTVKSDFFGLVTMPWDQVASATAVTPVNVAMKNGTTVRAAMEVANGTVKIAGLALAAADVATIRNADEERGYERAEHAGWGTLWAGSGNVGLSGTLGNAKTLTFTTGLKAARLTKTDKTSVTFEAVRASASVNGRDADTAKAVRGSVTYDHNLSPRIFASVFNAYEYDQFQNLDLRFALGAGLGYHAVKRPKTQLDLVGGVNYDRSKFSTPETVNSAELYFGDEYTYKMRSGAQITQSARMFNNVADSANYRANFDAGAQIRVAKWLNWNLILSDRYLNEPAAGRKTNDILYTTGFGISFAH